MPPSAVPAATAASRSCRCRARGRVRRAVHRPVQPQAARATRTSSIPCESAAARSYPTPRSRVQSGGSPPPAQHCGASSAPLVVHLRTSPHEPAGAESHERSDNGTSDHRHTHRAQWMTSDFQFGVGSEVFRDVTNLCRRAARPAYGLFDRFKCGPSAAWLAGNFRSNGSCHDTPPGRGGATTVPALRRDSARAYCSYLSLWGWDARISPAYVRTILGVPPSPWQAAFLDECREKSSRSDRLRCPHGV